MLQKWNKLKKQLFNLHSIPVLSHDFNKYSIQFRYRSNSETTKDFYLIINIYTWQNQYFELSSMCIFMIFCLMPLLKTGWLEFNCPGPLSKSSSGLSLTSVVWSVEKKENLMNSMQLFFGPHNLCSVLLMTILCKWVNLNKNYYSCCWLTNYYICKPCKVLLGRSYTEKTSCMKSVSCKLENMV